MVNKFIYLSIFITLVWYGMTQTGNDHTALNEQSRVYNQKNQKIIMRFFGMREDNIPVSIEALSIGMTTGFNEKTESFYSISNLSPNPLHLSYKVHISPEEAKGHVDIKNCYSTESIVLKAKETKKIPCSFLVKRSLPSKIGTVHIYLSFASAKKQNQAKSNKPNQTKN